VLDLVERRERGEADGALGRSLDVELDVPAGRQGGETALAAVGDDRLNAGQVREPFGEQLAPDVDVVRPRRIHPGRDREAEDLDQDAALGADRVPAAASGLVEGLAARPPFTVWASIITIEGVDLRPFRTRTIAASRTIALAQTPFSRLRRHCCQTAGQDGKRSGR
jgi:hypothetical protein